MGSADTASLLQTATAQFESGDKTAGERTLSQCLTSDPENPAVLDFAARVSMAKGDAVTAESYARRAVTKQTLAGYVLTLAETLKAQRKLQEALNLYAKIIEKLPNEPRSLYAMGEIYEEANERERAIACYERILDVVPGGDVSTAIKLSYLLTGPDLQRGMAALEKSRPAKDRGLKHQVTFLNHYVIYKEWAERYKHGQLVGHVSSLSESFFTYAAKERDELERAVDEFLKEEPHNKNANGIKAACLLSKGKRIEAEQFYRKAAEKGAASVIANVVFAPDFYRRLEAMTDDELTATLPPVEEIRSAAFSDAPIIYLSCNYEYFSDFARPMILSVDTAMPKAQIHLHIMDASDSGLDAVRTFCARLKNTTIAVTAERTGVDPTDLMARRSYYHAIRFVRLLVHLQKYRRPLWLMDVDAIMNRDPKPMFDSIGDADVAFRVRPGRWEPWNQFNASVIGWRPTPAAIHYLRLIAAYIADFHGKGQLRWGIDQLAMFGVHEYLKDEGRAPKIHLLGDKALDYDYQEDGFVWGSSGRGKFVQIKQIEKGKTSGTDPKSAKYFDAFRKYVLMLNS